MPLPNDRRSGSAVFAIGLLGRVDARAKLRDPVRRHDELYTTIAFGEHYGVCAVGTDIVDTAFPKCCDPLRLLDSHATGSCLGPSDKQGAAPERGLDLSIVNSASIARPSGSVSARRRYLYR